MNDFFPDSRFSSCFIFEKVRERLGYGRLCFDPPMRSVQLRFGLVVVDLVRVAGLAVRFSELPLLLNLIVVRCNFL